MPPRFILTLLRPPTIGASPRSAGADTKAILSVVETTESPPTFLRTNKFTAGFQGLVNTYGVPRYREMNPGAFAIILFPFLFAIMFGDVWHGSLLLLLAVGFIANEARRRPSRCMT